MLCCLLKRVVVADHEELCETAHTHDLLRKCFATLCVEIGRRFVKECNVDLAHFTDKSKAYGQRCAHLLAPGKLLEVADMAARFQRDAIIFAPLKVTAVVLHQLAKRLRGALADLVHQRLRHEGASLLDDRTDRCKRVCQLCQVSPLRGHRRMVRPVCLKRRDGRFVARLRGLQQIDAGTQATCLGACILLTQ